MKTLIIIPAFNEEENILKTLKCVRNYAAGVEILVIDDGSVDKTRELVRKEKIEIVSHPFNLGCGTALQTGYKYALKKNFDYIVQMDADGQHDAKFIKDLLEPVVARKADIVIGSRFLAHSYKADVIRRIGMIVFSFIVSKIVGKKMTDATSGFRAMNKKVVEFYTTDVYPTDFPDADLILATHFAGFKIIEIPVKMYPSPPNKKPIHSGLTPFYYVFKMFLSIFITLIRGGGK